MTIQGISEKKCINCNKCVLDCPENLFMAGNGQKPVTFNDPLNRCILCGHCLAVCPVNAVICDDPEDPLYHPDIARPEKLLEADDLMLFMRARRSIRQFRDKNVPEKSLNYVLSAMRYSPTGSNKQGIHFTVLTSKDKIDTLSDKVMNLFKAVKVLLIILRILFPFGRKRKGSVVSNALFRSLNNALEKAKAGKDPIFYHAPCVIILSAPTYAHQSPVDAGIALAHGMLAAQAHGLGTCLVGFAHERLLLGPLLRRSLQIPIGRKPVGVMALGFPKVRYRAAPMRKPLSVNRL